MNHRYLGHLIQTARQQKHIQKKHLCAGICELAMLKKIEEGKPEAEEEVIHRLLVRLGISGWEENSEAGRMIEYAYSLFFVYGFPELSGYLSEHPELKNSVFALDYELLWNVLHQGSALNEKFEDFMDERQLSVQQLLKNDPESAYATHPAALYQYLDAKRLYHNRREQKALERFHDAYALASLEGSIHLMLRCKVHLGKLYSRMLDAENMKANYDVARRIARALHDEKTIGWISYHEASVQIELCNYEEAYRYFRNLNNPSVMEVYKRAMLCEKLNRKEELAEALGILENTPHLSPTQQLLFGCIRYRHQKQNYLDDEEYEAMMSECYERMRKHYPKEYLLSFLPDYLTLLEHLNKTKEAELLREHYFA